MYPCSVDLAMDSLARVRAGFRRLAGSGTKRLTGRYKIWHVSGAVSASVTRVYSPPPLLAGFSFQRGGPYKSHGVIRARRGRTSSPIPSITSRAALRSALCFMPTRRRSRPRGRSRRSATSSWTSARSDSPATRFLRARRPSHISTSSASKVYASGTSRSPSK